MLGGEQATSCDLGEGVEHVDAAPAIPGPSGVVGDQADALAAEHLGQLALPDPVQPGADLRRGRGTLERPGSVPQRRRDHGGDVAAKLAHVAFPVGVETAGQQDHEGAACGVHPERCAGEAGVTEAAEGEVESPGLRVSGRYVPPEAAALLRSEIAEVTHGGHRLGREDALAAQRSFAEEHRAEAGEVVGGGEESGMTGHAAEEAGARVVDDSLKGRLALLRRLGGSTAGAARRVQGALQGVESRVPHAERPEEVPRGEGLQRESADRLHHPAENDETHVGVDELRVRSRSQAQVEDAAAGHRRALLVVGEGIVGKEPPAVAEELLDGDRLLAVAAEAREVAAHRVVERDLLRLDELHDRGGRGHRLGQGGAVEDDVGGHRPASGVDPVGLAVDPRAVPADEEDRAARRAGLQGGLDHAVDLGQLRGREAGLLR